MSCSASTHTLSTGHSAVPNVDSPLLSRKAAARYLGVASQTLASWACSRRYDLPYVTIGRLAMYLKTDLDGFIAKNKHINGMAESNGGRQ